MACGHASLYLRSSRDRLGYECVGVPPEKEVIPEPRENGATIAALGRILRGLFASAQ